MLEGEENIDEYIIERFRESTRLLPLTSNFWQERGVLHYRNMPYCNFKVLTVLSLMRNMTGFCQELYKSFERPTCTIIGFQYQNRVGFLIKDLWLADKILSDFDDGLNAWVLPNCKSDKLLAGSPPFNKDLAFFNDIFHEDYRSLCFLYLKDICINKLRSEICNVMHDVSPYRRSEKIQASRFSISFAKEVIMEICFGASSATDRHWRQKSELCMSALERMFEVKTRRDGLRHAFAFVAPTLGHRSMRSLSQDFDKCLRVLLNSYYDIHNMKVNAPQFCLVGKIGELLSQNKKLNLDGFERLVEYISAFCIETYLYINLLSSFAMFQMSWLIQDQTKANEELTPIRDTGFADASMDFFDNSKQLEYIVKEARRMASPLGFIARISKRQILVLDRFDKWYKIMPGELIFVPQQSMYMDQRFWTHPPAMFDPQRWKRERHCRDDSGGKYDCLLKYDEADKLKKFIYLAIKMFMATVLTSVELSPADSPMIAPFSPISHVTLRNDMFVRMKAPAWYNATQQPE